jgi:glycolate oxidase
MPLTLPEADQKTLDNRLGIIKNLKNFTKNVISDEDELKPYETDGLSVYRQ